MQAHSHGAAVSAADSHATHGQPAHLSPNAPRPTQPKIASGPMYLMHKVLEPNFLWGKVAAFLESQPALYKAFTWSEKITKNKLFGCRMCAQCAIPQTAYACPMTCPKQLRNGPCGGVGMDGSCEVYPGTKCVWLIAYERADDAGTVKDLRRLQRPIDQRKWGESSWVNYWLHRDDDLATEPNAYKGSPLINVDSEYDKSKKAAA